MSKRILFVVIAIVFCAVGCTQTRNDTAGDKLDRAVDSDMQILKGSVFYREKNMLPPGATLEVRLEDVSKMDVAATLIATSSQILQGAPPYTFTLEYDTARIDSARQYGLRATIMLDSRLLMTSTEHFNPFLDNLADHPILLRAVSSALPVSAGGSAAPLAPLTNTYWKLLNIGGQRVTMFEGQQREAFMQLRTDNTSLRGFAGCNSFSGRYRLAGPALQFDALATTRRFCNEGMQLEADFIAALSATSHYVIAREQLTLLAANQRPLAQFKAVYFN